MRDTAKKKEARNLHSAFMEADQFAYTSHRMQRKERQKGCRKEENNLVEYSSLELWK